jgi:hypothetical protein
VKLKCQQLVKIINEIVKNNPKKIDNNGDNDVAAGRSL